MNARRTGVVVLAGVVVVGVLWAATGGDDDPAPAVQPAPSSVAVPTVDLSSLTGTATPTATPMVSSTSTPTPAAARESGVPVTAPPDQGRTTEIVAVPQTPAASVVLAGRPVALDPAGLRSPETAVAAWAAAWCPFTFRDPVGAAEQRSQPAMTGAGWAGFDPRSSPAAASAWAGVVSSGSTASCSAPVAQISPEAPRSATAAFVKMSITRVVTPAQGPASVEKVFDTRLAIAPPDGHWLVDISAQGAG